MRLLSVFLAGTVAMGAAYGQPSPGNAPPQTAGGPALTLEQAVDLALRFNPKLAVTRQEIDALAALGRNRGAVYAFHAPGRSDAQRLPEAPTMSAVKAAAAPFENNAKLSPGAQALAGADQMVARAFK